MLRIAIITASTRPVRAGKHVTDWFYEQVKGTDNIEFEIIDLAEVNLPFLNEPEMPATGKYEGVQTKVWSQKVASFDGYILVTPEYNHGYPAPLKNAIDTVYNEWKKKPVAFVGYGVMGGARSIEQLVQVTAQIGMVPLPFVSVNILEPYKNIDDSGQINPDAIKGSSPERQIAEISWWANLLRSARS